MIRSFFGLWLLVFGPLFFLLYPSSYNPIAKFNEYIEGSRLIEVYSGTFALIESNLKLTPRKQWNSDVSELSSEFGYDLNLATPSSLNLNDDQLEQLQSGEIVFVNSEPEYLLKKALESDLIIQLYTDFSENEKITRGAQGTIQLIQSAFDSTSPSDWDHIINKLSEQVAFNLSIEKKNNLNFKQQELQDIHGQGFFWRGDSSQEITFYIDINDDEYILMADRVPMSSIDFSVIIYLVLVFVIIISIGMFLWVYPLWRDLNNLDSATAKFGKGDLSSRAKVSKISVVASLGRTFNQMAERMQQLMHGQKTLTNAVAHDLRTPLYRLRFAFEMLGDSDEKKRDSKYWSSISKSIDDLNHLVDQTLLLSKYSSEDQLMSLAQHNIASLINEECTQTFQLYPNIDHQAKIHLNSEEEIASIDKVAMQRAISNLLTNACKFASSFVTVELFYITEKKEYVLEVCDDGPGVQKDEHERIFLPFEQISNERSKANSGHGLGLAIVRHIAIWHKGNVLVDDSPLGGAKFTLRWSAQ